jgi:alpha-beta hydrolase superfamily lysophospholipase
MRSDESTMDGQRGVTLHTTVWSPDPTAAVIADVVLIHGLGEHSGRYLPVAESLCDAGIRVSTMDLRGHGRSTGVRRGDVDDFDLLVDDVAALVARTRSAGRPLFLYGHSMGGLAVLRYAERRDDELAGVVIASAALVPAESIPAALVKVVNGLGRAVPGLRTIQLEGDAISRDPDVRADYDSDPLNFRGKISAGTARQLNLAMTAGMAEADRVSCPVLIIHGGADRLTASRGSETLAGSLASDDVTLRIWPDAFHELHHEPEREEVLSTVVEWITERS